jgi:hypothetical protein
MADKVALIDSLCAKARILPVITIAREQDVLPLADALAAGGLTALEVTLRSQFGLKAIQILREQRPELVTGAGTVLDRHMLAAAEAPVRSSSSRRALPVTCWKPASPARSRCCRVSAMRRASWRATAWAIAASSCSRRKSAAASRPSRPWAARSAK